ncbi:M20/M25/M40 family metallo-hydrolase [Candidatus Uabimicrobium amorphum]|uniref:Selenium metabolism hydrolase n=1 Tax=Uabimicrobium amorphum TaxID=2596890 RepID=A0A5S9F2T0_UABAM|nr:M20/M25/M40 family metallo-hydrolase [Candidatus Uabimicrobium amorphum]BBM82684.1 selenium metabolism hydrolase [Candidatus Uabimicrobium amorphum]
MPTHEEIKTKSRGLHEYSVKLLSELIAAGAGDGGISGKEGPRGDIIEREFKTMTDLVCKDKFGNICAAIGEGKNPQTIVWLIGHFDTVGPGEWKEAYTPKLDGDKLYGRGSSDQLAGVVSSIAAMKILKESEEKLIEKGVRFVVTANPHEEECEGENIKYMLKNIANTSREYPDWMQKLPNIMVTTEPTSTRDGMPRPYFGHRGRYLYEIRMQGETGHGSIPVKVPVAEVFSRTIHNIFQKVTGPNSPKFGRDTYAFTTGKITSPSGNAHTEVAAWNIDLRIAPTSDPEHILKDMRKVAEEVTHEVAKEKNVTVEEMPQVAFSVVAPEDQTYNGYNFVALQELPGPWLAPTHPIYKRVMDVYTSLFSTPPYDKRDVASDGGNPDEGDCSVRDYYNFSTDLTGLAQMIRRAQKEGTDIPDIAYFGLGSGIEEEAHRQDEYCPVNSLDHATMYYVAFINSFLDE